MRGRQKNPEDLFMSVLNPHLSTNSLVLCGSCSGHKDEQVLPEAYRPILRYAWQNAGCDIGEPVDNFTGVIEYNLYRIYIIECAVMTCDDIAFLDCAFFSHSYCF